MATTFSTWWSTPGWKIDDRSDYPRLTWEAGPGELIEEPLIRYSGGLGTPDSPFLVGSAEDLDEVGKTPVDWNKYFELIDHIDLTGVSLHRIGVSENLPFTGHVNGNGYTISNYVLAIPREPSRLRVNNSLHLGIFGYIGPGIATIENIVLRDCHISSDDNDELERVGLLCGFAQSARFSNIHILDGSLSEIDESGGLLGWGEDVELLDCHVSRIVLDSDYEVCGGLVGRLIESQMDRCTAHQVEIIIRRREAGGLVGWCNSSIIKASSVQSVSVSYPRPNRLPENVGGLVGLTFPGCVLQDCYVEDVHIQGTSSLGGLVGSNQGAIQGCLSDGLIEGTERVGGLIGSNSGVVDMSFSLGSVRASGEYCGGLIGLNGGSVSTCFSRATVHSSNRGSGGFVGYNAGSISNSYSRGDVEGQNRVGGFAGINNQEVFNCYAIGHVSGSEEIGGFVGYATGNTVNCFWDVRASGQTTSAGGTGLPEAAMKTQNTYLSASWDFVNEVTNGLDDYWTMPCEGGSDPVLAWQPTRPVAYAGPDQEYLNFVPDSVTLDGSISCGLENDYVVYYWKQLTGPEIVLQESTESTIVITPFFPGNYVFELTVSDGLNISLPDQITVRLINESPVADAGDDQYFDDIPLQAVILDGSGSNDPGNDRLTYRWVQVNGPTTQFISDPNLPTALVEPEYLGAYVFQLIVNDGYTDSVADTVGISVGCPLPSEGKYCGGTGTPEDPYRIANGFQLQTVGKTQSDWGASFKVVADLDLSEFHGLGGSDTFNTIGRHFEIPFTGSFDGQNHIISNLRVVASSNFSNGLFGLVDGHDAVIRNVHLVNPDVDGGNSERVGSLIGRIFYGKVENCSANGGQVNGRDRVGGLIGDSIQATVIGCRAECQVSAVSSSGGLMGANEGTLIDSHGGGQVNASEIRAAGLVGLNWQNGTIEDCSSSAEVTGIWRVGGLVGESIGGYIAKSHADGPVFGQRVIGGLVGTSRTPLTNCYFKGTVEGADGSDRVGGLAGFSSEDVVDCYSEGIVSGLSDVGGLLGTHYQANVTRCYSTATVTGYATQSSFEGGAGGLIGSNTGVITDCWSISNVIGVRMVAGIVGSNTGDIVNCNWEGEISATGPFSGGLVAISYEGNIMNCQTHGTIHGGYATGGLVGESRSSVVECSSSVQIFASNNESFGGLVGLNHRGDIKRCVALGDVTGTNEIYSNEGGGLVGTNAGLILDSYSRGDVIGNTKIGGLVGANDGFFGEGYISNCYCTGVVSGVDGSEAGGLMGSNGEGIILNSFWDIESSGMFASDGGIGLVTMDMQADAWFLEAGWDFVDESENGQYEIWYQLDNDYPLLYWQASPGDGNYDGIVNALDLFNLAQWWLKSMDTLAPSQRLRFDFNDDGLVNYFDFFQIYAGYWVAED